MAKIILLDDLGSSYYQLKIELDDNSVKKYDIEFEQFRKIRELLFPIEKENKNYFEKNIYFNDPDFSDSISGINYIYNMSGAELCPIRYIIKQIVNK